MENAHPPIVPSDPDSSSPVNAMPPLQGRARQQRRRHSSAIGDAPPAEDTGHALQADPDEAVAVGSADANGDANRDDNGDDSAAEGTGWSGHEDDSQALPVMEPSRERLGGFLDDFSHLPTVEDFADLLVEDGEIYPARKVKAPVERVPPVMPLVEAKVSKARDAVEPSLAESPAMKREVNKVGPTDKVAALIPSKPTALPSRLSKGELKDLGTASAASTPRVLPVAEPKNLPDGGDGAESQIEPGDKPLVEGEIFQPPVISNIEPPPEQSRYRVFWTKIGGDSLALSIAIHVVLFVLAGFIIFNTQLPEKAIDFLPGGGTAQSEKANDEVHQKISQKRRSSLIKAAPLRKVVSSSETAMVKLPEVTPDFLDLPDVSSIMGGKLGSSGGFGSGGMGGGFGKGMGLGGAGGMVSLPASMRSRCSMADRLQKLAQNGGSPACEAAVSNSLAWLKTQQNKDGSWGSGYKAGYTGLALLCYLGHCETPDSLFYGENVMDGILYLIEVSKKNKSGYMAENPTNNGAAYEHGIATYALGEMYTLARLGGKSLPGMKEAFEAGVQRIIAHQNPTGGWDYYTSNFIDDKKMNTKRDDLSITGWQYQALKAAKHSNLRIAGLPEAIAKCTMYLESTQTQDGGFGVRDKNDIYNQYSLTGTAVLGLQTLSKGRTREIDRGIKFLHNFIASEPLQWDKNCNLYCWYYYTQAFFQKGGAEWQFYVQQLLPNLLNNQKPDGSWRPGNASYALVDAQDDVYRQALCTLQLEVFYRYLKVGAGEEGSFFDK